jgi:hypothetical protein
MFGYIRPDKPELKIKDFEVFRGYYCGLCKELKKEYTFFSRLFLNYDCTFLSLVLGATSKDSLCTKTQACSFSPLKRKKIVISKDAKFAAAINVILARNSILDNIKDEKKYYLYPLLWILHFGYNKAVKDYNAQSKIIDSALMDLHALEKANEPNIDRVSDVFAKMMGDLIVSMCHCDKEAFYHIGYHLGRWIYIIDAYDDLEQDYKNKSYNPIVLKYDFDGNNIDEFKKHVVSDIRFSLIYSLSEIAKGFDLITIYKHKQLLENIIYSGTKKKTESVLLKGEH